MPNLLKLFTKSVTNVWSGNSCPLIEEIKQMIRNIDMKIILSTKVGNTRRPCQNFEVAFEASFWFNKSIFQKVGLFSAFLSP